MSPSLLLDTSVASLLHPRKVHQTIRAAYQPELVGHTLAVSFQTVAEMYYWADRHNWGIAAKSELEHVIAGLVVLFPDDDLLHVWADIMAQASQAGRRLEAQDAWVIATATYFAMPLVTHDRDMIGLPIDGLTVITHLR